MQIYMALSCQNFSLLLCRVTELTQGLVWLCSDFCGNRLGQPATLLQRYALGSSREATGLDAGEAIKVPAVGPTVAQEANTQISFQPIQEGTSL